MSGMKRLLIVEDDQALGDGLCLALQSPELERVLCRRLADARAALTEGAGRNESVLYLTKATFGSRDLAEVLVQRRKEEPIEEIVLIGLCTDICVISNALVLKAFLPEVTISVDAACCAGVNPDSHRNALDAMRMCQIGVVNG